jgi:hypothetical protein
MPCTHLLDRTEAERDEALHLAAEQLRVERQVVLAVGLPRYKRDAGEMQVRCRGVERQVVLAVGLRGSRCTGGAP